MPRLFTGKNGDDDDTVSYTPSPWPFEDIPWVNLVDGWQYQ
jgi:hypothetical protein